MRIENLAKIIDGEISNTPSVTYIDQLRVNAKQIKRGDAFLCLEKDDLSEAIKNGAYAVIYKDNVKITDDEIAWIKIDDMEKSIIRYLRFKIMQTSFEMYYTDDITFQILKSTVLDKNILFLDKDLKINFLKIINANAGTLFLSNDKSFIESINPSYKTIKKTENDYINIVKFSIFQIDFIYDGFYHNNIKIPKIFATNINSSLEFIKNKNLRYRLNDLKITSHFEPIFVDNGLGVKDFGTTNKVIIVEKDIDLIKIEIEYLCKYAKYAKNCLIMSEENMIDGDCFDILTYKNFFDILNVKDIKSNFFLVLDNNENILMQLETYQKQKQKTLF